MSISYFSDHVETTLTIRPEWPIPLDREWLDGFNAVLKESLSQKDVSVLILDMSNIESIDGFFVGVVLSANAKAASQKDSFLQSHVSDDVMKEYRRLKVDTIFKFGESDAKTSSAH